MTPLEPSQPHPSLTAGERLRRFLWVAVVVAVLGEGGHQLLQRYGTELGHHAFHVGMVAVATLLFGVVVAYDVRRNGRPRFSWRMSSR